jgi:hypothetical protein
MTNDGYDVRTIYTDSGIRVQASDLVRMGSNPSWLLRMLCAREAPRGISRSRCRGHSAGQPAQGGNAAMTIGLANMTNHAPSDAEKQEIAAATGRHKKRPPRVAINVRQPENNVMEISPTHSDGQGWRTRLEDALGTASPEFVDTELVRLMTAFRDRAGIIDARAVNAALAVIDGLKPQNEIEAMLAVQIAVTHGLTMKFSARLYNGKIETIEEQDSTALTLSRLQRAFTTQMDALSNMRRGGRQKVVVEHVHVYPGGQAIVGNVTHTGRGVSNENGGQTHAADDKRAIAASGSIPMWCPDSARETLPVSNREGQEALSDARRSAGHRSTEG